MNVKKSYTDKELEKKLIEDFKNKIKKYNKYSFLISDHARIRAKQRNIIIDKLIENIINNEYLILVEKQEDNKYKLVYKRKKEQKEIYIIKLEKTFIHIITVWKELSKIQKQINKKWKKN